MPFNHDFSDIQNLRSAELHVEGWVDPIFVEYGLGMHQGTPSYFWRVKGTKHTFVIPVLRMNFISSGDYETHFKDALRQFCTDYLEWKEEGFTTEWSQEYRTQFSRFIA
jgi:hypothetical protein